jgi:hypothetical protein
MESKRSGTEVPDQSSLGGSDAPLCRWIPVAGSEKKAGGLSPDGAKGRKDLAQTTIKVKSGEAVMFSWIVFKSRAHRDRVNAKVMKDPRLAIKRMAYGGSGSWSTSDRT